MTKLLDALQLIDRVTRDEPFPRVVVDLDAFDRNAKKMVDWVRLHQVTQPQLRLRVASKSVRVPALLKRILDRPEWRDVFQGVMCFSALEAEYLASQKIDDLLIAYPIWSATELEAIDRIMALGRKVTVMVDSKEHLDQLAKSRASSKTPLRVAFDVDMSYRPFGGLLHLGVRRSPLRSVRAVVKLYDKIKKLPTLHFAGLMGYEAQVAGLGDRNPFKRWQNPLAAWIRRRSVKKVSQFRSELFEAFRKHEVSLELFNGGGTGSLNFALEENWLTEVTAGSGLLCSHLFDYYSNVEFEAACFFACQVVRSSDRNTITCQGGGYIASGEPGWDRVPVPVFPKGLSLMSTEGCGEVQTPLKVKGPKPPIGSAVWFRHAKAGEVMERFNQVILIQGEKCEVAQTYRGLGLCFF